MRRSASDIGTPGRDDATGYGLLNVPSALTFPASVKDPLEPNDDIDYVRPSGTYYTGIPALTSRSKRSTKLVGRIVAAEDPRDVYRVFVPARGRIAVKTTAAAGVDLALWRPATTSVTEPTSGRDRIARERRSTQSRRSPTRTKGPQ